MVWNNRFLIAGQSGTGRAGYTVTLSGSTAVRTNRYIVILDTTTTTCSILLTVVSNLYIDRIRARKGVDWVSFIRSHPRLLVVIGDLVVRNSTVRRRIGRAIIRLGIRCL